MKNSMDFHPVIIGAATGYAPDKTLLFINSIANTNYTGKVVLFVNPNQLLDYQIFYANKVDYAFQLDFEISRIGVFNSSEKISRNFKKMIRYISQYVVNFEPKLKQDFIYFFAPPHVSRFFDYYDYLQGHDFTHVVLTDIRDVIVQGNMNELNVTGLYLGMEDKGLLLGKDSFHIKWISDVYGKDYLNSIAQQQISCAGVTFGDHSSILGYLDVMIKEFLSLPYYTMVRSNYDQGIHNKLLYSHQFDQPNLCQPLNSKIATLGVMNISQICLDEHVNLINKDGTIPLFVHQYDRHLELEKKIIARYLSLS